ncbi:MAG TPA: DUF4870 domain-containing protein [Thermoanaerobaculia bacterium]|nr:DUF4870 domain-containing protein [Thermoanaerobaculia bacterium]
MSENPTVPPTPPSGGGYAPPPPPPPSGGAPPPAGGSDRTLMLALSYIYFLGVVPLLVKKDDREIKWHAINGLGLFAAYVIIQVVWWIVSDLIIGSAGCGLGVAFSFLSCAIGIGYIVVFIMAILKAVRGQRMRFPLISDFADKA